jgi:hypothetical protein
MNYFYNDGGRVAAGFKGYVGDCVARSVAIAAQLPYREVYNSLARGNASERRSKRGHLHSGKRTAREGIRVQRKWFKDYMASLGFRWVPCMRFGGGRLKQLQAGGLPPGRLVVSLYDHFTAVIDGVLNDVFDPAAIGARCVWGYWLFCEPTERR